MKKLPILLLLASFAAYADDMSDAARFYANKDYSRAIQLYSKLAQSGNPDAQEMLGEIYWFGDGVEADVNTAGLWFKKAADNGQKKAQQFQAVIQERQVKAAEISYYTTGFDGRDVSLSKFNCVQPSIPAVSKTIEEIKTISASVDAWHACYNRFVSNFNLSLPAGAAIPKSVSVLMNDAEVAQATALMDKKYTAISSDASKIAVDIDQKQRAWKQTTEEFIVADAQKRKVESDRMQNEIAAESLKGLAYVSTARTSSAPSRK
ncbi:tetratricopeptide repeat protein [Undibacterium sp. Di27W]